MHNLTNYHFILIICSQNHIFLENQIADMPNIIKIEKTKKWRIDQVLQVM